MTTVAILPEPVIRPIRPADAEELARFYERLSDESRRLRFFACLRGLSEPQARQFCCTDHDHREGFVACTNGPDGERIVGHLCLEPAGDGTAEVALAVADELQGHGLGRRLTDAGLAWARDAGLSHLTATMLAENAAIHRLLAGLGVPSRVRPIDFGVDRIMLDVSPSMALAA